MKPQRVVGELGGGVLPSSGHSEEFMKALNIPVPGAL